MATGPSPFSALAGPNAVAMAAALNTTTSSKLRCIYLTKSVVRHFLFKKDILCGFVNCL